LLNIEGEEEKQPAPLQCHFYDMRAGQDFCFFITESGELYVMGASKTGMLGLG
jgi:alpha-tubulin suppressor-like RCC1 family protein